MFDSFLLIRENRQKRQISVILVLDNAMAKIAIPIKSSPPGAGFYLLFIS